MTRFKLKIQVLLFFLACLIQLSSIGYVQVSSSSIGLATSKKSQYKENTSPTSSQNLFFELREILEENETNEEDECEKPFLKNNFNASNYVQSIITNSNFLNYYHKNYKVYLRRSAISLVIYYHQWKFYL